MKHISIKTLYLLTISTFLSSTVPTHALEMGLATLLYKGSMATLQSVAVGKATTYLSNKVYEHYKPQGTSRTSDQLCQVMLLTVPEQATMLRIGNTVTTDKIMKKHTIPCELPIPESYRGKTVLVSLPHIWLVKYLMQLALTHADKPAQFAKLCAYLDNSTKLKFIIGMPTQHFITEIMKPATTPSALYGMQVIPSEALNSRHISSGTLEGQILDITELLAHHHALQRFQAAAAQSVYELKDVEAKLYSAGAAFFAPLLLSATLPGNAPKEATKKIAHTAWDNRINMAKGLLGITVGSALTACGVPPLITATALHPRLLFSAGQSIVGAAVKIISTQHLNTQVAGGEAAIAWLSFAERWGGFALCHAIYHWGKERISPLPLSEHSDTLKKSDSLSEKTGAGPS